MTSAERFNAFAAARGEGLHRALRDLFERAAVSPSSELTFRHDGMLQAGPSPKPNDSQTVTTQPRIWRYRE
jgi:hypothetical protein